MRRACLPMLPANPEIECFIHLGEPTHPPRIASAARDPPDGERDSRALDHNRRHRAPRGASTQQVAKNLFRWPGRSYLRKARIGEFRL